MAQVAQLDLFNENPLTPSGLPDKAFFLCNGVMENRRGEFGVLYCGGDLFKNYEAFTTDRETRYMFVEFCTKEDAERISKIMNSQYAPPHPEGEYSVTPMFRIPYLLGGHKDEKGMVRKEND